MIFFILSLFVVIALGVLKSVWLTKIYSVLNLGLGVVLGLGIYGIEYFLFVKLLSSSLLLILLINVLAIGILIYFIKRGDIKLLLPKKIFPNDQFQKVLSIITFVSVFVFLIFLVLISVYHPYGQWDAWMMWNTKGIHLAHHDLITFFTKSLPSITHPSYPLLLPSILAHGFETVGTNSILIPIVISLLFCLSAILILWGGVYIISQENLFASHFSLLCLIISPFFLLESISQYADIPLSIYLMSLFILLILASTYKKTSMFILCGIILGFLILLKNEGLLISLSILFVWSVFIVFNRQWTFKGFLLTNLVFLPFVLALLYFKSLNVSQDHLNAMDFSFDGIVNQAYKNLFDIISYYIKTLFKFTEVIILIVIISAFKFFKISFKLSLKGYFLLFSIIVILLGYTVIYLLTPNIDFLLSASAKRLFLHVFPSLILLIGISLKYRYSKKLIPNTHRHNF